MELDKIERLLARYEEGETTLAEEKVLSDYFSKSEVPEHLSTYKLMFAFSAEQRTHKLESEPEIEEPRKNNRYAWTSIAAILIVALGIFFFNDSSRKINENDLGTINDEEIAMQKAKETLNMVSQIMNEGTADLVYLKEFNNTKNKIIQID